jgi:hypothetical protein
VSVVVIWLGRVVARMLGMSMGLDMVMRLWTRLGAWVRGWAGAWMRGWAGAWMRAWAGSWVGSRLGGWVGDGVVVIIWGGMGR